MKNHVSKYNEKVRQRKKKLAAKVKKTLCLLISEGISKEKMATDLGVSFGTIESWTRATRCPKFPTVKFIEATYGIPIL